MSRDIEGGAITPVALFNSDGTLVGSDNPIAVTITGGVVSYLVWSFHVPQSLTANLNMRWTVPQNCHVEHISAVTSNNSDARILLGISSDTDSILVSSAIGDSNTPLVFGEGNWAVTNPTGALTTGQIIVLTVDYDGASGTAGADITIIITASID